MTAQGSLRENLTPKIADQVEYIVCAFQREEIEIGVEKVDGGVDYMYAEGQLLVRDEYLDRVLDIIRPLEEPDPERAEPDPERAEPGPERAEPGRVQRVIAGVVLLTLRGTRLTVRDALIAIDRRLGAGIATPNHVLTVAGELGPCPATEPEEVYDGIEPSPSVCPGSGGAGVLIYIADTGLLATATSHSWLAGVTGGPDPGDGTQPIPPYTGHGTFVAGVARCMAPAAEVKVTNAFKIAGSALESHLVRHLAGALGGGVDIFHLAIAATSRKDIPLVAFEAWLKLLRQYKGVVCVAAAGNNDSRRPTWPGAFAEVVSVGALAADWRSRAKFSNFGGWVDAYAPGRDLVNAYAAGTYICHDAPYNGQVREFYGMARWSGTSFSTPVVTGLIAARMSRTGENGLEAAAALLAEARSRAIPGVGAILLPCCNNDDVPASRAECCCGTHQRGRGCC